MTKTQADILTFVKKYTAEKNLPPTGREIMKACNVSSTSVVSYNCEALVRVGLLASGPVGTARRFRLPSSNTSLDQYKQTIAGLILPK